MSISKKMINEIKQHVSIVDLANDYFQVGRKNGYLGISGESQDGGDFSSIVIYPETNTFFRQSNRHGGDVISFVQETHIEGIESFKDAVIFLKKRIDPEFNTDFSFQKKKSFEEMTRMEKIEKMRDCHNKLKAQLNIEQSYRNVMAYLIQERKIDPDIVKSGIKKGEIAQINMNGYKGVAFISKEMGLLSCISRRGITKNSSFKGDFKGCNYDYGWRVFPDDAKKKGIDLDAKIYCFEGYIDMLSFKTLAKKNNIDLSKDIFVVCGSANKYACVVNTVKEFHRDVVICFDNDTAGKELGTELKQKIQVYGKKTDRDINVKQIFSKGKDWNDDLKDCVARSIVKQKNEMNSKKKMSLL